MTISRRNFVMGTTAIALTAPATIGRAQTDNIKFASILDLSGGLDIYGAPMAETQSTHKAMISSTARDRDYSQSGTDRSSESSQACAQ